MVTFPKLCFNDIGLPFGSGAVKSGATEPTSTAATGFKNLSNFHVLCLSTIYPKQYNID